MFALENAGPFGPSLTPSDFRERACNKRVEKADSPQSGPFPLPRCFSSLRRLCSPRSSKRSTPAPTYATPLSSPPIKPWEAACVCPSEPGAPCRSLDRTGRAELTGCTRATAVTTQRKLSRSRLGDVAVQAGARLGQRRAATENEAIRTWLFLLRGAALILCHELTHPHPALRTQSRRRSDASRRARPRPSRSGRRRRPTAHRSVSLRLALFETGVRSLPGRTHINQLSPATTGSSSRGRRPSGSRLSGSLPSDRSSCPPAGAGAGGEPSEGPVRTRECSIGPEAVENDSICATSSKTRTLMKNVVSYEAYKLVKEFGVAFSARTVTGRGHRTKSGGTPTRKRILFFQNAC